jgi:hypothetical protein
LSELPVFQLAIQRLEVLVGSSVEPLYVYLTLAIIMPFTTPDPASSVVCALVVLERVGMTCPWAERGERVTFPLPSV